MRRARRRLASVTFCARTFQKPARYFCYCPTGPSRRAGRGLPTGGCLLYVQHWRVCPVVFWRVVWYLRGRDRINVVPVVPVVPGHAWPSWPCRGRRGSRLCGLWICRRRVVATRRWMLVFPMVSMASHYPDLHNRFVVCIVIAIKQTTTERNGDEREATTTKPTAARTVTRSPLNRRGMDV